MFAVALALLLTFILSAISSITSQQKRTYAEFDTLARITALNSQPALMFRDAGAGQETVDALAPYPGIIMAEIIAADGSLLASRGFTPFRHRDPESSSLTWEIAALLPVLAGAPRNIEVSRPVLFEGRQLGSVRIRGDLIPSLIGVIDQMAVFLGVMLAAFALSSYLVGRRMKQVMQPILALDQSARSIAENKHYWLRVEKLADDELGNLTDQFNYMLQEIERRDQALTERNESLEALVESRTTSIRRSMEGMNALLNALAEGALGLDAEGCCQFANPSFLRMFGLSDQDILIGQPCGALLRCATPDNTFIHQLQQLLRSGEFAHFQELQLLRADQTPVIVECWLRPILIAQHQEGTVITFVDIGQRKQAEEETRIAATAFDTHDGIVITDSEKRILRVNRAFTRITGYNAEEVLGQSPNLLKSGRHDDRFYADMWTAIQQTGTWEGEIWNRRKNGKIYPEHLSITAVVGNHGETTHYVGTFADISKSKLDEDEIRKLAFYDPLTGLPNRRLLLDRRRQAAAASVRHQNEVALLFLDLDQFKTLNDTLGHAIGDTLLEQVAGRISGSIRQGDTVARLGGDEFVVMLEDLSANSMEAAAQTEIIAEKLLAALGEPYDLNGIEYHITASIGATLFRDHNLDIDELLRQADIAMYQSKKAGRNTLRFFDPQMQAAISTRAELEGELRKAMKKEEFHLHFQMQTDVTGTPLGAEVLLRWQHPERGSISPATFIPLAEETGLIIPIGDWVIDQACAQISQWQQHPRTRNLVLSVNVSARQFHQPEFVDKILEALRRHQTPAARLKLELTESMLLGDVNDIIRKMEALESVGVRFSLDDFGTGYSSLQYLKRLPLCQLKIDQLFVRDIATDENDRSIVETIVSMSKSMNIEVIAEGVETNEQKNLLIASGCTQFQGYLFSRPVPLAEFEQLVLP